MARVVSVPKSVALGVIAGLALLAYAAPTVRAQSGITCPGTQTKAWGLSTCQATAGLPLRVVQLTTPPPATTYSVTSVNLQPAAGGSPRSVTPGSGWTFVLPNFCSGVLGLVGAQRTIPLAVTMTLQTKTAAAAAVASPSSKPAPPGATPLGQKRPGETPPPSPPQPAVAPSPSAASTTSTVRLGVLTELCGPP